MALGEGADVVQLDELPKAAVAQTERLKAWEKLWCAPLVAIIIKQQLA
jgi:hypothetical protein